MIKRTFRWIYDFEQMESWLNEMAAKGWMLKSFFAGFFQFSKGEPGEYSYRVELLPHFAWSARNRSYLQFTKETGVELVCLWVKWAVFRKKTREGEFNIYTDTASRIMHYRRISRFLMFFSIFEWCITLWMGGMLVHGWVSGDFGVDFSYIYSIICLFFSFLIGLLIFNASRRARRKYERLKKEEPFIE